MQEQDFYGPGEQEAGEGADEKELEVGSDPKLRNLRTHRSFSSSEIEQIQISYKLAYEELLNKKQHPKLNAFTSWLKKSLENKDWYLRNKDKIRLVDGGVEILGEVFCLEDEQAEANGVDVFTSNGLTYFTHSSAIKHAKAQGKKLPASWSTYIEFLPGDSKNKIQFLSEVLGLNAAGYRNDKNGTYSSVGLDAVYLSVSPSLLYYNSKNLYIDGLYGYNYGFALRCVKDISITTNSNEK